ncbi:MAG: PA14 domain-containing protein, partial [Limisphaerales bacterium]
VTNGVAVRPDLSYAARADYTALAFTGYIKIPVTGNYTFYLTSDLGSGLYVGQPSVSCAVVGTGSIAQTIPLVQALGDRKREPWVETDGEAVFVGRDDRSLEIELAEKGSRVTVTVVEGSGLFSTNLLQRRLRVKGVCEFSRDPMEREFSGVVVPGAEQVEILPLAEAGLRNYSTNDLLTMAVQVRRMSQAQATLKIPADIKGIVMAADQYSLVLQDGSGGVFIHFDSSNAPVRPAVGQLWEVEGKTDSGDFSPVLLADRMKFLGSAAMPEPIRPTWDQLMNGSLDAEYVEIRGVVTAISTNEMTLLIPDGVVTVMSDEPRPLPRVSLSPAGSLIGSVVRIRGRFTADWNWGTRQVIPGRFYLYPAATEVEEPAPRDPFALPTTTAADLMEFNARASALQLTKVTGQIVCARAGEFFVLDGQTGIRVLANKPAMRAGDLVEAVGFPKLGGPSPVLQDAQIRKTGRALLPAPVRLAETNVLDRSHDATLVEVKGLLLSDSLQGDERVLELQSGAQRFAAILKSDARTWEPFAPGSRLQLTGAYSSEEQPPVGGSFYPFEILLNSAAGIIVLQQPSWWTVRHAVTVVAVLGMTLGLAFIWITVLH